MFKGISKFLFIFLYIAFMNLLVFPFKANAVSQSSISVNVVPENPAPGEDTTISLSSYLSNLDSVLITWSVDGRSVSSGIGKKSFTVKAPSAGGEISIGTTIYLPDGSIDKRILLRPSAMILLWQATDSYVPPFYKGKAFPTPDSQVRVVAMPEIRSGSGTVNATNMTYAWKKDYTNEPNGSGYGRNSFTYVNDYLEADNTVSVVASTIDQQSSSEASIDVPTVEPKILFYKNDNTLGTIWEHALSDGYRVVGDAVVEAAPYFISPGDIRIPSLTWDWSINDNTIDIIGFRKNLMPLKVQPGVSGTSKIRLEINNLYKVFQTAEKEMNVTF